jgi:hypothetical protein
MATKKKTKKKQARPKRTAGKKLKATKNKKVAKKKMARKKAAQKRPAVKARAAGKRTIGGKRMAAPKERARRKSQSIDTVALSVEETVSRSGGQSGDLQGLSNLERASSESVDELLEEGNAFEADVVMGVEDAEAAEGREVRTHEVPEDDVPGEYRDKD